MARHMLRVHAPGETTPRAEQLAWKLAEIAADDVAIDAEAAGMAMNRVVDNAAVSIAALARRPVANARAQAIAHPHPHGATVVGNGTAVKVACEWAAWANATAVRELDFHDTFLAADMNHPGDMIPALTAVAQQRGLAGADLVRAILTAYEVDVALTKAICLNKHRIDHIAHLAAGTVAGLGDLLRLPVEVTFQAINHAVHVAITTRQSRKGEISSWKAYAPAHVAKLAIEAVDRAMRGESGPSPIYEGDDSIIAWLLKGPEAEYELELPTPGAPRRAILETYTKAHSAEYQAQALIDLAFRLRARLPDVDAVAEVTIHTSDHTHRIIGNGANDPQKYDPKASRETLDHSAMYIFAVALAVGTWHHDASYSPARAHAVAPLWRKIRTVEDDEWTRRYHEPDPGRRAFGARAVITLADGTELEDELAVADAHPNGAQPYVRDDYVAKFRTLADGIVEGSEIDRFLDAALGLGALGNGELDALGIEVAAEVRDPVPPRTGLFEVTA